MDEQQKKSPFPKILAIYLPLNEGGVGVRVQQSLRAKEDYAEFVEHPHEVEIFIKPPETVPHRKPVLHHYKIHKSRIRYIEYAE
jgi:hypothetical protein